MKLKDIYNAEEYLKHGQYCHYEIYYTGGMCCNLFYPDQDCHKILDGWDDESKQDVVIVRTKVKGEKCFAILVFWIEDGAIDDARAFDDTAEKRAYLKKLFEKKEEE